jgi:RND family efflux transporter MFP subunit
MTSPRPWQIAVAALIALAIALVAWRAVSGHKAGADTPPAAALVGVASVRATTVRETVKAYGVIAGSAQASHTVAAPRGVIVVRLLVGPGQPVAAGAPLLELASTPAAELAYRQATDATAFAGRDLERVQRLFDQRLAASDQLGAARKALGDAKAALAAQTATGAGGGRQTLASPFAGVVGAVTVTVGEHVAADAPLMTIIGTGGLVAQLGVEPTKAGRLATGQAVSVASAFDPARHAEARLAVVGRQVDPTTRLVTVTAPSPDAGLPLGAAVQGEITVASHPGLLVPRAAVVFDESGAHVFAIQGAKAHQVAVTTGADQGADVEVIGALRAGEAVAVAGAYQLQDGARVRTSSR